MALHTGHEMEPYLDQCVNQLVQQAIAFQPSVRREALQALGACVQASVQAFSMPIRSTALSTVLHSKTESHADAVAGPVAFLSSLYEICDGVRVGRHFEECTWALRVCEDDREWGGGNEICGDDGQRHACWR